MSTFRFITYSIFTMLCFYGCGPSIPDSFVPVTRQTWEVLAIKPSMRYDEAWQRAMYIITKKFELEMMSKEDGYIRSAYGPSYFSEDIQKDYYQVRITVKFSPNRQKLEFKIESRVYKKDMWRNGSDTRIAANMKKEFLYSLSE